MILLIEWVRGTRRCRVWSGAWQDWIDLGVLIDAFFFFSFGFKLTPGRCRSKCIDRWLRGNDNLPGMLQYCSTRRSIVVSWTCRPEGRLIGNRAEWCLDVYPRHLLPPTSHSYSRNPPHHSRSLPFIRHLCLSLCQLISRRAFWPSGSSDVFRLSCVGSSLVRACFSRFHLVTLPVPRSDYCWKMRTDWSDSPSLCAGTIYFPPTSSQFNLLTACI